MNNLQNFINNLIAYKIILFEAKTTEGSIARIKRIYPEVYDLLKNKHNPATITTNLESIGLNDNNRNFLTAFESEFALLPLLIAHHDVYRPIDTNIIIKSILTKHSFNQDELWLLYDSINKSSMHFPLVLKFFEQEHKEAILEYISDNDSRKAYEKAKLKLEKERFML